MTLSIRTAQYQKDRLLHGLVYATRTAWMQV